MKIKQSYGCSKMQIYWKEGRDMSNIPKDPNMLYSYVNMMLRDRCESLKELCSSLDVPQEEILNKLADAGYQYDITLNQFR